MDECVNLGYDVAYHDWEETSTIDRIPLGHRIAPSPSQPFEKSGSPQTRMLPSGHTQELVADGIMAVKPKQSITITKTR